jgi:hypothetical protein
MKPVISPLKSGDHGPDVANLQGALLLLIDKGLIQLSPADAKLFKNLLSQEQQGQAYNGGTFKAVVIFQQQHHLQPTGAVDAPTADAFNQILKDLAPQYRVEGRVASRSRAGVGGLRVQMVDKNVGADVRLTEVSTADDGSYRAAFPYSGPKQKPDLQARVLSGEKVLGASDVHYNASNAVTLNVVLPDGANASLASEHETLTSALAVHYTGPLGNLKEGPDQHDITYLANKSGWDARAVALAALADQFSQRATAANAAIHPAFFYALFRAGVPANDDALYRMDSGTVTSIWQKAAQQGILSQNQVDMIPKIAVQFQSLSAQKLLTSPALAGASPLKDMLSVSGLTSDQQQKFAQLYTANQSDPPTFWKSVGASLGQKIADRLQLDGKLGFMTLNSAPLMQVLHTTAGANGLSDPLQLAQAGYYKADSWMKVLTADIPIPAQIPGASRENYATSLATLMRVSYPTAAVALMIKSGELPLTGAASGTSDKVHAFLTEHQGTFEIGVQPIQQYIHSNKLDVPEEVVTQLKRVQRVYQMTPSDQATKGLLTRGIDAAYHVVRFDRDTFVASFQQDVGGAEVAAQIYEKALHIHTTCLNLAVSYMTARNGLTPGALPMQIGKHDGGSSGQILRPAPASVDGGDVIAYPTLEGLFGSMDFCSCDECRSVLSPAAYLVDLLMFIDQPPPSGTDKENPLTVLLTRRPDIQHLPLTCENTNTALPYIDVVNETLEYFVANDVQKLSLTAYIGHDTDGMASADLLASPQFVMDSAYTILQNERFPAPLPFSQPLEELRRHFNTCGVALPLAMERLRKNNDLERGANLYGWRDILMEAVSLSRDEYEILTDSTADPLWRLYGFPNGTPDADVIATLSNVKQFTVRVGITYDDIVALVQTRFINPNGDLLPKLKRLDVPFTTLKELKDGTLLDADFAKLLPTGTQAPDPAMYGGDITGWVKDNANSARIMALITLTNPVGATNSCSFDQLEFRYSRPMTNINDTSTRIGTAEYVRLLRFIRLWKKLGWSIEQTDALICSLYRADLTPLGAGDIDTVAKLDVGFLTLLPRLGIVVRVLNVLNLSVPNDLLPLLACWSDLGTYGDSALYRQMFLNPALLKQDAVFADNGYGVLLANNPQKLADHAEAIRSAFNLTGDEYHQIVAALSYNANTILSISNISAIYRRGYLARRLHLSVREFLLLTQMSGFDPFAAPNPTNPAILRLISFVQALKARSLKSAVALYLIWNQDLSGKSAPDPKQVTELARTLRGDYARIEDQFAVTEDPGGDLAHARMTLVYGQEAADAFFTLLDKTIVQDVPYTHTAPTLEPTITAVDSKLSYDDFRHLLSHTGLLDATTQDKLKTVGGNTPLFQKVVDQLFNRSEDARGSFFTRYPELKPLYDAYIISVDPPEQKRSALLAAFQPELSRLRKQQQALQRLSAATNTDLTFAQTLLNPTISSGAAYPLHAAGHNDQPALHDVLTLETPGLATTFFYRDTATGAVDLSISASANLDYSVTNGNPLPANPAAGTVISGIWHGSFETPEAGFYNFVIEADLGALVTLNFAGQAQSLTQNGTIWRNTGPLNLKAGTLYEIVLTVEQIKDTLSVKWETKKRPREVIPARYLYPPTVLQPFSDVYTRFLKVASLATVLRLSANEMAHFATDADFQIVGDGWLNLLPVHGSPTAATAAALLKSFQGLLDFARIKASIAPGDEQLLTILEDPTRTTANGGNLLQTLTHWDAASLTALLTRFGSTLTGLTHLALFVRVYDAFALIQVMGITGSVLLAATTNAPTGDTLRTLQAALHALYAIDDWRDVIQPINDEMRGLQRDGLVAYILHQMRSNPATAQIDTADKLFEFFLMDVQMEPCMLTSRIRYDLSSVQLFIERCLMNLETSVSPASIIAPQWEWMKRYRVWEANRKVFLFPENWLEPELRDDKSPFFKEIESELLQSDITDDTATSALLNYLSKLEEVAKLEPCGIFHIPADASAHTGEIDHVISRTAGAHRKYYYRRYEYGYWTPWEQIKLDIEDNPVLPVIWKGRLLLFWLRILKQAPLNPDSQPAASGPKDDNGKEKTLAEANLSEIKTTSKDDARSNTKVTVQAVLCWSEYYNGKWQPTKTSDVNNPTELDQFDAAGTGAFDRYELVLSVIEETLVEDKDTSRLRVVVSGQGTTSFLLYNTHSLPEGGQPYPYRSNDAGPRRGLLTSDDTFTITYLTGIDPFYSHTTYWSRPVLKVPDGMHYSAFGPNHTLPKPWDAPFFFQDSRNVFFVTTEEQKVWIHTYPHYGVSVNPGFKEVTQIPPLVLQIDPGLLVKPRLQPLGNGRPNDPDPGAFDPTALRSFVSEDAYINKGIGSNGSVMYGDSQIGPTGTIANINTKI